jgi:predicted lipid-binding transport protein (Tim44 family)
MATGMTSGGEHGSAKPRPISALPSVQARVLAFGAIVTAGVCGGLIGFSAVKVGCQGNCSTPEGIGGLTGALIAATGVSVIAVLVLRAMGEWRSIKEKRPLEMVVAAAASFTAGPTAHEVRPAPEEVHPAAGEADARPGPAEPEAPEAPGPAERTISEPEAPEAPEPEPAEPAEEAHGPRNAVEGVSGERFDLPDDPSGSPAP